MSRALTIAASILFSSAFPGLASSSPTSETRWSLGGSISLPYEYNKYGLSSFGYSLKPEASYFVLPGLEISGGLILANILESGQFAAPRMKPPANFHWGFQIGLHYFIQLESAVQPYFGLDFGTVMKAWEYKQLLWFIQVPVGIAWFLNPNVALNFGIPLSLSFSSTALFEKLNVSPGYLGLRAFF